MPFISGTFATVQMQELPPPGLGIEPPALPGPSLAFNKWKLSMKTGLPKVTNFTSLGFQELVGGVISATITLEGPYKLTELPILVGGYYNFFLGWSIGAGLQIVVRAWVETIEPSVDVENTNMVTVTAQSHGVFGAAID